MKKNGLILAGIFACCCAFAAGVSLEIDGRAQKIKVGESTGLPTLYPSNGENKIYYLEFRDKETAPLTWKEYSVSFVPEKTGYVTLGFATSGDTKKGMSCWVEYDKIEVINSSLRNPSFELLSTKNEIFSWRYYTKNTEKINQKDAADGKNYIAVLRAMPVRQSMHVKAGQKVTIKFMARSGGMTPLEKPTKYGSDQYAPQAK